MNRYYSHLKFFHYADHIDAIREGRIAAPLHIRWKPINRCNHDCWYCAYKVGNLKLGENMNEADTMPPEKAMEVADDLVEMGVKAVTFSGGGEPLIYRPLPDVIERLARGGVKVASLTNGAALKGRMADAFAAHATWVRISIDGWDGPSYAKARHVPEEEFDRVVGNMRDFAARGSDCVLGVTYIVTQENHRHIVDMARLMKDVGVRHVKFSGVVVGNDGASNNPYHAGMFDEARAAIDEARKLADSDFGIIDFYHEIDDRFDKTYTRCLSMTMVPVIGADCGVYTCHDKAYMNGGLLGYIHERRFKDLWFAEETRQRILSLDPSRECRHHCTAHLKNLALNEFLSQDPEHLGFV